MVPERKQAGNSVMDRDPWGDQYVQYSSKTGKELCT